MNKKEQQALKEAYQKAEESKQSTFDSWIVDLEDGEQPDTCSIDDEDCEACGS